MMVVCQNLVVSNRNRLDLLKKKEIPWMWENVRVKGKAEEPGPEIWGPGCSEDSSWRNKYSLFRVLWDK